MGCHGGSLGLADTWNASKHYLTGSVDVDRNTPALVRNSDISFDESKLISSHTTTNIKLENTADISSTQLSCDFPCPGRPKLFYEELAQLGLGTYVYQSCAIRLGVGLATINGDIGCNPLIQYTIHVVERQGNITIILVRI